MSNQNVDVTPFINTSGQGKDAIVPEIVKNKFNWGAFLLSWIWGIGNKTWIALIAPLLPLIPFVGAFAALGFNIWLGIKGNEFAWKNKKFDTVEKFHENQKIWAIVGIVLFIIGVILYAIIAAASIAILGTMQTVK